MNRYLYFLFFVFLCSCKPNPDYTLDIVHTNDLHAHIQPFNAYGDCTSDEECLGGFARIISFMAQEKKNRPQTLFVDAGDRFTGTAFYSLTKSRYLLPLFKMMPYDAATLGNHEFDDNLSETVLFIEQWGVPIVAANLKIAPEEKLYSFVRPSIIVEKNKKKIGIIGVITPEANILSGAQISVLPVKKSVATEIKRMEEQGVDIIVVVSHIGLTEDIKLAKALPNIDVIIGGHSHSLLINDKNNVLRRGAYPLAVNHGKTLIVSSGMGGQFVGHLRVKFDSVGQIVNYGGDSVAMSSRIPSQEDAVKIIEKAERHVDDIIHEPLADLPYEYGYTAGKDYCGTECPIGEYLAYLLAQKFPHIDGVLINSGAIRSALPAGKMTYGHLLECYPYDTPAVLIIMNGRELKKYIRHGIMHYHKRGKTNELLQTFGVRYTFTPDDKRLLYITVGGEPVDLERTYVFLTSSFITNGGDRYPLKKYADTGFTIREILAEQLKNQQHLSYIPQGNVQIFKK